jgi:hypothetical protein
LVHACSVSIGLLNHYHIYFCNIAILLELDVELTKRSVIELFNFFFNIWAKILRF